MTHKLKWNPRDERQAAYNRYSRVGIVMLAANKNNGNDLFTRLIVTIFSPNYLLWLFRTVAHFSRREKSVALIWFSVRSHVWNIHTAGHEALARWLFYFPVNFTNVKQIYSIAMNMIHTHTRDNIFNTRHIQFVKNRFYHIHCRFHQIHEELTRKTRNGQAWHFPHNTPTV